MAEITSGGGGFGGAGGRNEYGGQPYGNLALLLEGGSGGATGYDNYIGFTSPGWPGGGAGGGCVAITAGGEIRVSGALLANGGDGENSGPDAGVGGGGHILLHVRELVPQELVLTGSLDVSGGTAWGMRSSSFPGDGQDGRLLLQADRTIISAGQRLTMQTDPDRLEIAPGRFIHFATGDWQIDGELIVNP